MDNPHRAGDSVVLRPQAGRGTDIATLSHGSVTHTADGDAVTAIHQQDAWRSSTIPSSYYLYYIISLLFLAHR